VTVSPREQLPTVRGRQTQAAIDAAARAVVARKGILAATVSDIAAEAGRSTASFYNYYESKEAMVRQWAQRILEEAHQRRQLARDPSLGNREHSVEIITAHWHTYRNRFAEIIAVSQMATVSAEFAKHWADICQTSISLMVAIVKRAQGQGYATDDDPNLIAIALISMLNGFGYTHFSANGRAETSDDEACITTLTNIFYRTVYHKEGGPI
jgi:AcrR family transcriptional regulator